MIIMIIINLFDEGNTVVDSHLNNSSGSWSHVHCEFIPFSRVEGVECKLIYMELRSSM